MAKREVKNKRLSMPDLLKFICCLLVVWIHASYFYYPDANDNYHFALARIVVEVFFILMGYFVMRHFDDAKYERLPIDKKVGESWKYTLSKFVNYVPHILVAVLGFYLIKILGGQFGTAKDLVIGVEKLPLEVLLLGNQYAGGYGAIWFISASFLIYPLFCTMCQTKHKNLLYSVLFLACVVFYADFDLYTKTTDWQSLVRAFFGLSLGVLTYAGAKMMAGIKGKKWLPAVASVVELVAIAGGFVLMHPADYGLRMDNTYTSLILLCFVVGIGAHLSLQTWQSRVHVPLSNYLGKMSMYVFLYHSLVLEYIYVFMPGADRKVRLLTLFVASIVVAAIAEYGERTIKSLSKKKV